MKESPKVKKPKRLNFPGLYYEKTNKKGSATKKLMITIGKEYKFMFVIKDNGKESIDDLKLLVKNSCCNKKEWISRNTFLRRLKYSAACKKCGKPNSRIDDEEYYTKLCGGSAEGWGQFLAGPFGRFNDCIGRE